MAETKRPTPTRVAGGALAAVLFTAGFATPALAMTPEVVNVFGGLNTASLISDQQVQQQQQHKMADNNMASGKPASLSELARDA